MFPPSFLLYVYWGFHHVILTSETFSFTSSFNNFAAQPMAICTGTLHEMYKMKGASGRNKVMNSTLPTLAERHLVGYFTA